MPTLVQNERMVEVIFSPCSFYRSGAGREDGPKMLPKPTKQRVHMYVCVLLKSSFLKSIHSSLKNDEQSVK
jgi:hypothetical protein